MTNLLVASTVLLGAVIAPAATITMDVDTLDFANRAGTLHFSENGGTSEIAGWTGVIQVRFDGQPSSGFYDTLCVDLFHNISVNTTYQVTAQGLTTIANGGRVAWLYSNWISLGSMQGLANSLGISSNEAGMGLQLAVWDIIHDGGDGLSNGLIRATTASNGFAGTNTNVVRAANHLEQISANQLSTEASIYLDAVNGIRTQRQISVPFALLTTSNAAAETPEPGTLAMAGFALAALALGRRKN